MGAAKRRRRFPVARHRSPSVVTVSSFGKDPAQGAGTGSELRLPGCEHFTPYASSKTRQQTLPPGERKRADGGRARSGWGHGGRNQWSSEAGGKSQRTCAEDTKYREAGRKEAHLPQEVGEKTRFVRRLRSYKSGRGREERQTTHACPELDPLSLRAETPDTCSKCPRRESSRIFSRSVGRTTALTGQPSWARPPFPVSPVSSSLFPFPSRSSYCLTCLPMPL